MGKYTKKPQVRKRTKPTTGQNKFVDVVYLERERIDGKEVVYGVCTCGNWRSSSEATTINKVGVEAKKHVASGPCQLRSHA